MNPTKDSLNEIRLQNHPKIREEDIKEYVLDRFNDVLKKPTINDLVTFHSSNKYLLMAHSQEKSRILGNIVANHEKKPLDKLLTDYQPNLLETLDCKPTIKTHINVLMHIFGFFGKYLNQKEKKIFLEFIKNYRKNKTTLGKILSEIEPITFKIDTMYLVSQTYFLLYSEPVTENIFQITDPRIFSE